MEIIDFKPIFDDVLVIELAPEKMRGGIIIPDTAAENQRIGYVVAVGHGRVNRMSGELFPILPKVHDIVKFREVPEELIEVNGKKFLHIKEFDIEGFYEGETKDVLRTAFLDTNTWLKGLVEVAHG